MNSDKLWPPRLLDLLLNAFDGLGIVLAARFSWGLGFRAFF